MLDTAVECARILGNDHSVAALCLSRSLTAVAAGEIEVGVAARGRASR